MSEKDKLFYFLLEYEKYCDAKGTIIHRWSKPEWDDYLRVWVRRCEKCGAIEVWRVNDSIIYFKDRGIFIFHDRHEFTESKEKAISMLKHFMAL
jgi:hypothetical protein